MPTALITIDETIQSIIRPSIIDITDQIKTITGINKDIHIIFPGEGNSAIQPGSVIGDHDRSPSFHGHNQISIEAEWEYDYPSINTTAVAQYDQVPCFQDLKLGVTIKPVRVSVNFVITFKYRNTSKTSANRWRDDIRTRVSHMRDVNLHKLHYHYLFPNPYIKLIKHIYDLRESQGGYKETFETYFEEHSHAGLTVLTDLIGEHSRAAIKETQSRVIGLFDFEGIPEKITKDDGNMWENTFTYKFSMDVPISFTALYPIVIHNQLIDPYFISDISVTKDVTNTPKEFSYSLGALEHFSCTDFTIGQIKRNEHITFPPEDYFEPKRKISSTVPILTLLTLKDIKQPKLLLNINDIDPLEIDEEIIKFITESEYQYVTKPYNSIFLFSLYQGDDLISGNNVVLTPNLDLYCETELDVRKRYHVKFSIINDISVLSPDALKRLRKYPAMFAFYLYNIYGEDIKHLSNFYSENDIDAHAIFSNASVNKLSSFDELMSLKSDDYVSDLLFMRLRRDAELINRLKFQSLHGIAAGSQTTMRTVMTGWIISHKSKDLKN